MQDIISAVPPWLLRWGITVFFCILVLIISLAAIVKYPDVVNASLKIDSPNSPKPVIAKISGKLVKLMVNDNQQIIANQLMAFIESTANHEQVLRLLSDVNTLQKQLLVSRTNVDLFLNTPVNLQLGELQSSYQAFYQAYLTFKSAVSDGFYIKKRTYLLNDLVDIQNQKKYLVAQKILQERDFSLTTDEYEVHKKLTAQSVETPMELKQNESKYLAKKSILIQTESSLISLNNNYSEKLKEILELDNIISEEKSKFLQALNSFISDMESWKSKYVLSASIAGKVSFAGIIQQSQVLTANQEVFYIDPGNEHFFGEMNVPQASLGKVKVGQDVLVKVRSYPFQEYGMLRGKINSIADVPYKDSIFASKITFNIQSSSDIKKPIHLKIGMIADAEIITQDATILDRIARNIVKLGH